MTYPHPSDDGGSVLIRARTRPNNPTKLQTFLVAKEDGEPYDLTLITAVCQQDDATFPALTNQQTGSIECPRCGREYLLEFDSNDEPVWVSDRLLELK